MDHSPPDAAGQALALVRLGRVADALDLVERTLADDRVPLADKPALRYAAAVAHHALGQHHRQIAAADACLAAARRLGSPGWMACARTLRAMAEIHLDRVDVALRLLAQAEQELTRTTDPGLRSWAHNGLGYCYITLRLYELALPHMEQAVPGADPIPSPLAPVIHALNLAEVHLRWADEIERAAPEGTPTDDVRTHRATANTHARTALDEARRMGHAQMTANAKALELVTRPAELADATVEELRAVWADPDHVDHIGGQATVGTALARALWRSGQREEALQIADRAAALSDDATDWQVTANARWLQTEMAVEMGVEGAAAGRAYALTLSRVLWRQRLATLHGARAAQEVEAMQDQIRTARREASSDPLTGVGNRRALDERLTELALSPSERPTSLLLVDLDHFKAINDQHGHGVGDALLRAIADAITGAARRGDLVVRLGGDEFVVVAPDTDAAEAHVVAARVQEVAEAAHVVVEGAGPVAVTISVGSATTGPALPVQGLLEAADAAMYDAKHRRAG